MVHVAIREAVEVGGEQVHQLLERGLLARESESARRIGRPDGVPAAVVLHHPEQVFQALLDGVWAAPDAEEHTSRGRGAGGAARPRSGSIGSFLCSGGRSSYLTRPSRRPSSWMRA